MTRLPTTVAAAAALATMLGSAPAFAVTQEEIANLTGPDREKILIEGAKKEGEVSFYTTLLVDEVGRPMQEAFQKLHPYLKLSAVRQGSAEIMQRVLAESRSRSMRVDVIDADAPEVMKASGIGMPFTTPSAANYPKHYMDPDRTWVVNRNSWQGIAWNTKLVSDADAPKNWEAAADPKWKGKLAWAESSGTGAPRLFTHVRKLWGEDKAMDYLKKLQANGVRTLPGSVRTVLDQVIAGEYAVGLSMSMHHIAESQSKGAPIAGISPAPQLARAQMLHYVKGGPHPHAGMLLVDYILSKDGGQAVYRDTGYNPAHPDVEPLPHLRWFTPKASGHADFLMEPEEVESYRGKSQDLYKSMFR